MKPREIISILIVLLFFLSCITKAIIPPVPEEEVAGDELFLRAENLYHEKSYKEAFEKYNRYLSYFPNNQHLKT